MNWFAYAAAGVLSGMLGAMGMGGGGILIIYFALFTAIPQSTAQGINLLFFIPIGLLSVIIYSVKGLVNFRVAAAFTLFGIAGSFLGSYLFSVLDDKLLSKIFGILLLVMGVKELFSKKRQ